MAAELPHSADAQAAARPAARVARRYVACALVLLLFTAAMVVMERSGLRGACGSPVRFCCCRW